MAKKSFSKRRRIVKQKKSILPKLILGAVVVGGGYLVYKNVIKPMLNPADDSAGTNDIDSAIDTTVNAANSTTANVPSTSASNQFSPMGTTWENLKKTIPITYGSKGQEVLTMQKLINKILKNQGWTTRIAEDGDFGPATWNVHKNLSFKAQDLNWWWNASENGIPGVAPKGYTGSASASSDGGGVSGTLVGAAVGGPAGAILGSAYDLYNWFTGD